MKKNIHPKYRPVIFLDNGAGFSFLTQSTVATNDTMKWTDGQEYPVYRVEISSASHPFFTGKMKFLDTAGRVDRFQKKYQNTKYGKKVEEKTDDKK